MLVYMYYAGLHVLSGVWTREEVLKSLSIDWSLENIGATQNAKETRGVFGLCFQIIIFSF